MYSLASVMPGNSGDSAAGVIGRWNASIGGPTAAVKSGNGKHQAISRAPCSLFVLLLLERSARARTAGGSTCRRRVGHYPSSRGLMGLFSAGELFAGGVCFQSVRSCGNDLSLVNSSCSGSVVIKEI
jgi:hypothetical protein